MQKQVLSMLATLCIGWITGQELSAQAPVFSNYGVQNLTYDYRLFPDIDPTQSQDQSTVQKLETACEGNNLHMVWQNGKWGTYAVWYRRSKDLGKTWEEPVEILPYRGEEYRGGTLSDNNKVMEVKDGVVNIVVSKGYGNLDYMRSTDGIHFETTTVANFDGYAGCEDAHMKIEGNKIAIAFHHYDNIYVAYSSDAGKTFKLIDATIPKGSTLNDFAFDGKHMVIYSSRAYGYYNVYGQVIATYSDDYGENFKHNMLSPVLATENGENIYRSWLWRHGLTDRQPSQYMALEGKHCYAIFSSRLSEEDDTKYVVFVQSDDYGKTWGTPRCLDTDEIKASWIDVKCMVKAKGDNVYVILPTNQETGQYENAHTVFHSHDCGKTFGTQDAWVKSTHIRGHLTNYDLTFDPNDSSGQIAYITNNDYCWIKTTDGFRTICQATFGDSNCPDGTGFWDNLLTQLQIDKNGNRHWFITYRPSYSKCHDVCYRRDAGEPEPSATNQSFLLKGKNNGHVGSRVNIPASTTYQATDAMTVELWAKVTDPERETMIAYHSHSHYYSYSGGWSFSKSKPWWSNNQLYFRLSFYNDKDDNVELNQMEHESNQRDQDKYIELNKWYHLAFTFDSEKQNVAFYINGTLIVEKKIAGKYDWGWNPINLGHCSSYYESDGYELDNFRVWNRVLTAEELRASMLDNKLTKANGLCVNIGFDGTLRDLSGNGNDGYGASDVDFTPSNRNMPDMAFDFYRTETGEVKFTSRTNASNLLWNFGDGKTSTLTHPTHIYDKPGEYVVTLSGSNESTTAYAQQTVSVSGLTGISPTEAGNTGDLMLTIMGGGLTNSSRVKIVRNGVEIVALQSTLVSPGVLRAMMPIDGAEYGQWDVVVDDKTLPNALTITETEKSEPWMSIDGRNICLYNKWQTYTINYGNKGNVDAYNVPLNLFISDLPGMEVELIDFGFAYPQFDETKYDRTEIEAFYHELDKMGPYSVITDNKNQNWRCYPIVVPVVEAGSSNSVHIRVKSPGDFQFKYWTNDGWGLFDDDEDSTTRANRSRTRIDEDKLKCMAEYLLWGLLDAGASIVDVSCALNIGKTLGYVVNDYSKFAAGIDNHFNWSNFGWNCAGTIVSCGLGQLEGAAKIGWYTGVFISSVFSGVANTVAVKGCAGGPDNDKNVNARSSWDPNEMVGPSGYCDDKGQHWIKSGGAMPYTILFENKAEASAPAHTVFVSDTLDVKKYDLSQFNFTAVGWGDSIVSIVGGSNTEFCQDIDLRPAKPLILRASGKLHPETGIVEWMFVSLNPETMEEEEDPMIGFLPPNDDNHAGEGFVSFVVGQQLLNSGDRIKNQASIVFDANAPILTNTYVNAIDDDLPTSAAYLITEEGSQLRVQWSGSDASSGVAHYEVWMTKNDGEFENISSHNPEESMLIQADRSTNYGFYTVVTDHVGNVEHKSQLCEVKFTTAGLKDVETISDPQLRNDGSRQCEIVLPRDMRDVQLTVLSADGNVMLKEDMGSGQRFKFELPNAGGSIVVITTGTGDRFSWKVANK